MSIPLEIAKGLWEQSCRADENSPLSIDICDEATPRSQGVPGPRLFQLSPSANDPSNATDLGKIAGWRPSSQGLRRQPYIKT